MTSKTAYIIAGPTAVGKTAIAIALAQQLGTEILSADSRQCYREMEIGTARPSVEELDAVTHHFIGEYSIETSLTAADYEQYALNCLNKIFSNRDTAVVCGGTGLYLKALCEGLDEMPDVDPVIEEQVNSAYRANGMLWLQAQVKLHDPLFFESAEIHNPHRMLRALSFVQTTGQSILTYRKQQPQPRPFNMVKICLELPREVLYNRINTRVDAMMANGLLAEAEGLYPRRELKNLSTVGYAEIFEYISGHCSLTEAVDKIKQHTRNYAKRQMTWFRNDTGYKWLDANDTEIVKKILALHKNEA